jgi:hypothetical protein
LSAITETGVQETSRDRLSWAKRGGVGRASAFGAIAGVLVAYAAFAVLVGVATAVGRALGIGVDLTDREWRQVGFGAGITVGVLLFLAYLFGGYVSGRMARRAGLTNGLLVFIGGLVVAGATLGIVEAAGESGQALDRLREGMTTFGVPVSGHQWGDIATVAGIAALAGMLLGAVLGGALGERWHAKVARAALDAEIREHPRPTGRSNAEEPASKFGWSRSPAANGHRKHKGDNPSENSDIEDLTKVELYQRAQEAEIEGRSQMTKDELIEALSDKQT